MLRLRAFVEDCLRQAQIEGSVDRDLPTRPLALLVMGCVHAAARGRPADPWRRDEGPEAIWETLKTLLRRASPSPSPTATATATATPEGGRPRRAEG